MAHVGEWSRRKGADKTADVFRRLGASVDERIYPGMGHIISPDEISAVRALLAG